MKARDIIKKIEADGWYLDRQKGVTDNTSTKQKKGWLRLRRINFQMTLRLEL